MTTAGSEELTVAEAARRTGVNPKTIRRRLPEGFPNAHQDASGQWWIPTSDLITANFRVAPAEPVRSPEARSTLLPERGEGTLSADLAAAEQRAAVAEAQLSEVRGRLSDVSARLEEIRSDKDATIAALRQTINDQDQRIAQIERQS
jgi:hypothetical protein